MVGAIIFTSLADRLGRKPIHLACQYSMFAVGLVIAFAPNYVAFVVLRFIQGAVREVTACIPRLYHQCHFFITYAVLLFLTTVSAVLLLLIISLQSNMTIETSFVCCIYNTHSRAKHAVD